LDVQHKLIKRKVELTLVMIPFDHVMLV